MSSVIVDLISNFAMANYCGDKRLGFSNTRVFFDSGPLEFHQNVVFDGSIFWWTVMKSGHFDVVQ